MNTDEYQAAYARFLTLMHTGEMPKGASLKPLSARYVNDGQEWFGDVSDPGTVEYTDGDIEFEQRRAMQESLDRRN